MSTLSQTYLDAVERLKAITSRGISSMKIVALLLITGVGLLGGCLATKPSISPAPWIFYQAHDDPHKDAPSPFFLTMKEAQQYCERMNSQPQNNYQVSFIAR